MERPDLDILSGGKPDYPKLINKTNGVLYEEDDPQFVFVQDSSRYDKDVGNYNFALLIEELGKLKQKIEDAKTDLVNQMYPVGSIIITAENTNPANTLPNTRWELLEEGRCLFNMGNGITDRGGSAEIQEHNHTINTSYLSDALQDGLTGIPLYGFVGLNGEYVNASILPDKTILDDVDQNKNNYRVPTIQKDNTNTSKFGPRRIGSTQGHIKLQHRHSFQGNISTENTGNGASGNLPPYIGVYFWKRIP